MAGFKKKPKTLLSELVKYQNLYNMYKFKVWEILQKIEKDDRIQEEEKKR